MRRIPTEKQMGQLSTAARPTCEVLGVASNREWKALVKRGWLEDGTLATSLRITPAGLRALADALEAYGRSA